LRLRILTCGLLGSLGLLTMACVASTPSSRSLHEVDGQIVHSRPPSPAAYEAYLRARMALDAVPPRPEEALVELERLNRFAPKDAHLWATRAEAHALLGDNDAARQAANKALALDPESGKARRVLADLPGSKAAVRANTGPGLP
jgi:tetratricopeptide (TPR) repeat protein